MQQCLDLFNIAEEQFIGFVNKVDSYSVNISTTDEEQLRRVNVNGYVIMHTSDPNTRLIGRIERVVRLEYEPNNYDEDDDETYNINNDITVLLD